MRKETPATAKTETKTALALEMLAMTLGKPVNRCINPRNPNPVPQEVYIKEVKKELLQGKLNKTHKDEIIQTQARSSTPVTTSQTRTPPAPALEVLMLRTSSPSPSETNNNQPESIKN